MTTRDGLAGFGECGRVAAHELAEARRLVAGLPETSYETVRRRLAALPALQAATNMALLDIIGRQTKAPVYQVLGGPTRFKARVMTRLTGSTEQELAAGIDRAKAAGFRAVSVPLPPSTARNQGRAFVRGAKKRLEALRAAAGEDCDFVLDGAAALTPGDAASLAAALERFHLLWFDEPCAKLNAGALRKLAAENVTPIGWGRHVTDGAAFQDLLREDCIDILRPDIALNGITGIRKMAALAETYYVAVAPYHQGGPVATAAALHLAASLPNFFIQQIPPAWDPRDRAMREEIAGRSLEAVQDGFAGLPAGPGLGITVNEQALRKYQEAAL